jgi:hypothetical protein
MAIRAQGFSLSPALHRDLGLEGLPARSCSRAASLAGSIQATQLSPNALPLPRKKREQKRSPLPLPCQSQKSLSHCLAAMWSSPPITFSRNLSRWSSGPERVIPRQHGPQSSTPLCPDASQGKFRSSCGPRHPYRYSRTVTVHRARCTLKNAQV